MSEVCVEFSQNAWRKDLCANCLRPRSEHIKSTSDQAKPRKSSVGKGSAPIPAKRNSTLLKSTVPRSTTVYDKNANEKQSADDVKLLSIKALPGYDESQTDSHADSIEKAAEVCGQSAEKDDDTRVKTPPTKASRLLKSSLKSSFNKEPNKNQRVVIADSEPEIIGYDGGIDYLYPEEETLELLDPSPPEGIQLTEEEKQFALLSLENTLWNSDIHNLRVETPIEGRLKRVPSKEFEDVELEFLWKADRFTGLKDCDLFPKKFGTFPRRSRSPKTQLSSRPSAEFLLDPHKSPENELNFRLRSGSDSSSLYQSNSPKYGATINVMAQSMTEDTSGLKVDHSSPHRSIELLPKPAPKPLTLKKGLSEFTEKPVPTVRHKDDREKNRQHLMSRSVEGRLEDCSDKQEIVESDTLKRQKPPAPAKRQHINKEGTLGRRDEMSASFAGTTLERKFDRDEMSLLKVDASDARFSKAKSVDFEAKMASVAATLDFNKTKGKRQAPQAPVSPLHDGTASPSKSPAKNLDLGSRSKSLSVEQAQKSTLSDEGETMDGIDSYKGKNNEGRMKKGFASMFRSFLRRGRDSSSDSSTEQSFDNSSSGKGNEISKDIPAIMYDSKSDLLSTECNTSDENISGQFRVRVFPSPTKSTVSVASTASSTSNEGLDSRPPSEMTASEKRLDSQERQKDSGEELVESNPPSRKSTMSHESVHRSNSMSNSSNVSDNVEDVVVVRRRVKSPKKMPAPNAPSTARVAPTSEKNALFAKELEQRLSKAVENKTGTLKKSPAPKPPEPPPPLPDSEGTEKTSTSSGTNTAAAVLSSSSQDSSRQDSMTEIRPIEKIELPKAAQSRRSFLGKFAGNRRSRPPPPPVKRAKSITEASLPTHDTHMKKIDLADISAPVLIAEVSPSGAVSRRNTVTLGDDSAFGSGGSTSSGSGGDKNFDDTNMSPLGSVENLYEPITPKFPGQRDNYYYPVDPSRSNSASRTSSNGSSNFPSEGYLEPITSMRTSGNTSVTPVPATPPIASTGIATCVSPVPATETVKQAPPLIEPSRSSFTESSTESSPQLSAELPPSREAPVEMTMDEEERKKILASQPIYEEINGYSKTNAEDVPPPLPKDNKVPRSAAAENKLPLQSRSSDTSQETSPPPPPLPVAPIPQPTMGTLTRPKPAPRRKPKRPHGAPPEQYVAMNRPATVTTSLGAEDVKEMYGKITNMNQDTLQHIHNYLENIFSRNLDRSLGSLKWTDFELTSNQPVHTSEDCIVYSARLINDRASCHLVLTHDNNVSDSYVPHPAFMKLQNISNKDIPPSFLPASMSASIDQSSMLPTGASSSSTPAVPSIHWHLAVGQYSIVVAWHDYITDLKDTMIHNPDSFIQILSFLFLQVVSGVLHHLDRGSPQMHFQPVGIFLLSQKSFSGKRVCLLPSFRLDNNLSSDLNNFCAKLLQDLFESYISGDEKLTECSKGLQRGLELLQSDKTDCLAIVRGMLELLIWGPYPSELAGSSFVSQEQAYDFWLDKERAMMVNRFARCSLDPSGSFSIEDFYKLRFLLNSTGTTLVENSQYIV